MNRDHRLLPRTLAALLGLVLLLVSGFAAQRTLSVCRHAQRAEAATFGGCTRPCCVAADAAPRCCADADHESCRAPADRAPARVGDVGPDLPTSHAGGCAGGCCFAVDIDHENGPLPRTLDVDVEAPLLAVLPIARLTQPTTATATAAHPFATGPTGPDRRTELRRAIQLLI